MRHGVKLRRRIEQNPCGAMRTFRRSATRNKNKNPAAHLRAIGVRNAVFFSPDTCADQLDKFPERRRIIGRRRRVSFTGCTRLPDKGERARLRTRVTMHDCGATSRDDTVGMVVARLSAVADADMTVTSTATMKTATELRRSPSRQVRSRQRIRASRAIVRRNGRGRGKRTSSHGMPPPGARGPSTCRGRSSTLATRKTPRSTFNSRR